MFETMFSWALMKRRSHTRYLRNRFAIDPSAALALPGVLMLCEFWIGELLMFSASLLPSPAVALAEWRK